MAVQRFNLGQLPATPWKNGGGSTRELACWPPGADMEHFDWRVSLATIAQSGPFSRFAGVDRVITLLTGDGVHLRQPEADIDHRLDQVLEPFAFAGDGGVDCDLLRGTSQDLNLMTRRGRWCGAVRVKRARAVLPAQPAGLLLALQGRWTAAPLAACASQAVVLEPDTGLWWADEACGWNVVPGSGSGSGSGSWSAAAAGGHGGVDAGDNVLLHVWLQPACGLSQP